MKKLIASIVCFFISATAIAATLTNSFSTGTTYQWGLGISSMSTTNVDLNAAYTYNSAGAAMGVRFTSPVTQSSANVTAYFYLVTKTGSPVNTVVDLYPGPSGADDPQRPGSGAVVCTATTDVSGVTAPAWVTFSLTGCTLTQGTSYWLVGYNTTGTPASNFPSYRSRAANVYTNARFPMLNTTNGFTTDPSAPSTGAEAPCVIKFSDGTLLGNAYVVSTGHASNTNDRGNGYVFNYPIMIAGIVPFSLPSGGTTGIKVYQGTTELASVTFDLNQKNNNTNMILFPTPITFQAGKRYDIMFVGFTGNTTTFSRYDAGTSPPTDVSNALLNNIYYVEGTAGTPSSYTATQGGQGGIILLVQELMGGGIFIQ